MNVGRLVVGLVVVVVLYGVLTQPLATAQTVRGGVGQLGVAGDRAAQFVMALVGSSGGGSRVVPTGGAAAGDGSSAP